MRDHGEALLPAVGRSVVREDTWRPVPGVDPEDGRAMNELLFADPGLCRVRSWIAPPTDFVVGCALETVEARLASADAGDVIRVLDYGAGTGLASIELLKACRRRNVEEQLERRRASLEVHVVDRPNPWFAHGFAVLGHCAWTRFHSLAADDGGFRPLLEVTGGRRMDVVMAANVFHLIPARALGRAAEDLSSVVEPGGRVTWCSPDLRPSGSGAVLFHDSNRALRRRWLDILSGELERGSGDHEPARSASPALAEVAATVRASLDPAARADAQRRADAHILAEPNDVQEVVDALEADLSGHVDRPVYETRDEDFLRALLVPSIQEEYMAEIRDKDSREEVIRELMVGAVLPEMGQRGARTADGLKVRWNLGDFVRRS